ncbi:MAG: hypothetical protein HZB59_09555 [Ignavibacteriales bacterium]|nr:hypothetical protein [Ignavibacteriales bacterium]
MKISFKYLSPLFYFFAWHASISFAQNITIQLIPSDIPDGQIIRTVQYDHNSLWGYINGGADIYLEYGFMKVTAQEVRIDSFHFKVDIYEMNSPEAAFGIFSVSHKKCPGNDSLAQFVCSSSHHLQCVSGKFYISIINDNGIEEEQNISRLIAGKILSKLPLIKLELPSFCKAELLSPHIDKLIFIKGRLGIENGIPDLADVFDDVKSYSFYFLPVETDSGMINITQITIDARSDRVRFFKKLGIQQPDLNKSSQLIIGKKIKWCRRLSLKQFIYVESTLELKVVTPLIKTIESMN